MLNKFDLKEDHILFKEQIERSSYYIEFEKMIDDLLKVLSPSERENLFSHKLQINSKKFNLKQFIQGAVELTVMIRHLTPKTPIYSMLSVEG